MKKSFLRKILNVISALAIVSQSLTPYVVLLPQASYAQTVDETTVSPTPEPSPADANSADATIVDQTTPPADTQTPTPIVDETTQTETVTPVPTDVPAEEVTPASNAADATPTVTPVDNLSPPVDSSQTSTDTSAQVQGDQTSITPTPASNAADATPTPIQVPENPKDEQLNIIVLENVSAPTVNLDAVVSEGSAVLTTDKPDYAPTDTALITGSNLLPNTTYTLRVWSNDEPPTSTTVEVTSDENGVFAYAYQLDGTYRPNYSAELKDSSGTVVATVTFTDSHISSHVCVTDVQGANDEPGQKDLTKMCYDYSGLSTSIATEWNWDDTAWPGTNTGDACALFDTDGDGNANYATCVTIEDGPPAVQVSGSPRVFSCNDTRSDRCAGDILIPSPGSYSTTCTVTQQATQPFPVGDSTPNDTNASCTIFMSEVGGGTAQLVDVCSFPSDVPHSDPSDCIKTAARTGKLEVIKDLLPSNDTGLFNLQIDGSTISANVSDGGTTGEQVVSIGSHTVGETAGTGTSLTDYTSSISCRDLNGLGNPPIASSSNSGPLTINIVDNADVVCTITNTLQTATITVNKTLVPSNDPGLFNLRIDGSTAGTGANVGDGGTTGAVTVNITSQHTVSETAGTNTSLSDYTTTYSCNNNLSGSGTSVPAFSVTANQNVICTFTNTLRPTHLTLVKTVTNDNGGSALATAWTLSASGPTPISGVTGDSSVTNALVTAGTYTLSESGGPSGYTASDYSCVKNGGNPVSGNSITLAPGDDATCTINNNDVQPKLTVTKVVVNDNGGTKVVSDFPLFVGATGVTSGVQNGFNAGSYVVSETQQTGYTQTSITGNCDANGNVTLAAGDVKSCTITNNDNVPALHLRKTITNDNGGSALITDWTLTATGTGGSPTNLSGSTPVDSGSNFKADTYALGESESTGYTAGAWDCGQATMPDATHVTVPLGADVTCTINNNDTPAHLIVIKHVITDNGGTAVAGDFIMTINGVTAAGGNSFAGAESPGTNKTLTTVGAYNVTESESSGYSASYSTDCTGTIALGETKTCTVTNNDDAPTLTLIKEVTNNNGGAEVASAWTLTASGPTGFSGSGPSVNNGTSFDAGTYNLSESGPSGYSASDWVCVGGVQTDGDTVVVGLGDNVTCTIINDDQAATLIVRKVVINDNGGALEADDFSFQVNGGGAQAFEADGQNNLTVNAGTYSVTEPGVSGYATTYDNCSNLNIPNGGSATCTITNNDIAPQLTVIKHVINDNGGNAVAGNFSMIVTGTNVSSTPFGGSESGTTVTLDAGSYSVGEIGLTGYSASFSADCSGIIAIGGQKTCTVTNDDQQAYIIVDKTVVNDNGGNAIPDSFNLTVDGGVALDGVAVPVNPGVHTAGETLSPGYTAGTWGGDCNTNASVTVALGETKTCTITNNDIAPKLHLRKVVVNDNGGTATIADFTLTADGTGANDLSGTSPVDGDAGLLADVWTLSETPLAGYTASAWVCVGGKQTGSDIKVDVGGEATCTITNDDITPQLTVIKHVVGGTNVAGDFTMSVSGTNVSNPSFAGSETGTTVTLNAGSYSVSETDPSGYTESDSADCSGTIALGQSKTCTITNTRDTGTIELKKVWSGTTSSVDLNIGTTAGDYDVDQETGLTTNDTTGANPVDTGTYYVSENLTNASDYTSSLTCVDAANNNATVTVGQDNSVTVEKDQQIVCTFTNTRQAGELLVHKFVDTNADNQYETEDASANVLGFGWNLDDSSTYNNFGTPATTLDTGNYDVYEKDVTDYHFVGWYFTGELDDNDYPYSCNNPQDTSYPINVNVDADKATEITLCNAIDTGTVVVHKDVQGPNGKDVADDSSNFQVSLDGGTGQNITDDETVTYDNVPVGSHTITESLIDPDYTLYGISETQGTSGNTQGLQINVVNDQTTHVYVTNRQKTGTITGTKWSDLNENALRDCELFDLDGQPNRRLRFCEYTEPVLGDWTIFLDENENEKLDGEEVSTTTDSNGNYQFTVNPGTYRVCEVIKSGWDQTYPINSEYESYCYDIEVGSGDELTDYDFGNHSTTPILTISKVNDASGNKAPGDIVGFTITIATDEEGGPTTNVQVTDLLPEGFIYVAGSWGASSAGHGDLFVPEPTYASPGVWNLVDTTNSNTPYIFSPGDTIILTYSAKIDGNQATGTYYDNTWGQGTAVGNSDIIFARAIDPGDLDPSVDPSEFVGTEVKIVNGNRAGVDYKATSTKEVLGASTFLPATGENTLWVIIATLLSGLGLGSLILGIKLRRKYV